MYNQYIRIHLILAAKGVQNYAQELMTTHADTCIYTHRSS